MKRHKYLFRLVAIFVLVLFVPVMAFFAFFWQRSYREMEAGNEAYYNKLSESFMNDVEVEFKTLQRHATSICANSKHQDSVFWLGSEAFNSNVYWYYEAVNEIRENYSEHGVTDCGIYYYNSDSVITKLCRQSRASYEENVLSLETTGLSFFEEESWRPSTMLFGTTNSAETLDGDLLVGFCVTLGKHADKVLIFYRISPEDSGRLISFVAHNSGIEFYVMDRDSSQVYLALRESNDPIPVSTEELNAYRTEKSSFPISFSVRVMSDSLQNRITIFYRNMRALWFFTAIILLVICLLALYLSYYPMHLLTKELDDTNQGEFEMIRSALKSKDSVISEQRQMIINLLVDHLLYGDHISRRHLSELGLSVSEGQTYCVFLIEGDTFLNGETEQLSQAAEKQFQIRLFVTDTENESKNIAIAFLNEVDSITVSAWMNHWLQEHFAADYCITAGKEVDKLDDIRTSFVSCYKQANNLADLSTVKKDLESLEYKEERKKKLQDDILSYLERHYCDADLSQTQVADEFHISTYSLSRIFNNQIGTGFTKYVNTKRIDMAKELLISTEDSARDISGQVGLPNYNYFLRLFKDTVGVTPTDYRAAARKESSDGSLSS